MDELQLYFLPEADCFSFAFLSKANEKKSFLCALCASAVKKNQRIRHRNY
jgi:hypothetical protein